MLLFGHAGITLGAAALLAGAAGRHAPPGGKVSWFAALAARIDVRLLLMGSLLPDIIDKPLGQYFLRDTFSHGRIFAHTLLFLIVIGAAGLYLYRRYRQVWLLTLAFGTLAHLVLDEIWLSPETLLWPLLGFAFPRIDLSAWLGGIFQALLGEPRVYIPELAGLALLLWFGLSLAGRRKVGVFLRRGRVPPA